MPYATQELRVSKSKAGFPDLDTKLWTSQIQNSEVLHYTKLL